MCAIQGRREPIRQVRDRDPHDKVTRWQPSGGAEADDPRRCSHIQAHSRARPNVNARSSTRRRGRSWHAEPTNQGVDQLMNGLYSFCNLSVMQQNFWARCHPSICSKITPVFGMPATKIGRRTSGYRTKARAKPSQPLRPTVWIAVASRPGCSPSFAASDVPPLRRHRRTQQESRRHE